MGGGSFLGGFPSSRDGADGAFQGFPSPLNTLVKEKEEEAAEKELKARIEILSVSFEKSAAYTNLIMLGGYAGAFAIWSYTKDQLTRDGSVTVALLLGISLTVFVLFEIFKMITNMKVMLKQRDILIAGHPPAKFLQELQKHARQVKLSAFRYIVPIWCAALMISLTSAVGGIGLLFYNFLAILAGFERWPG